MKNTVLTSLKLTIAAILILFTTHAYATDWETCSTAPSSKETFVFPVTYTKNLEVGADTQASLLETIRTEAALCEVFPYRLLCGWDGYIYRYELTFERYLPFYRFKQRVASASRMDIEQCVSAFDGLNNREKAFVLTALFIFERSRRLRDVPQKSVTDGSKEQEYCYRMELSDPVDLRRISKLAEDGDASGLRSLFSESISVFPAQRLSEYIQERAASGEYVPAYCYNPEFCGVFTPLLYPDYAPDEQIDSSVWRRWRDVIAGCADVNEVAFEGFRSDDLLFPMEKVTRENARSLGKLAVDWIENLDLCETIIEQNLGFNVSDEDFLADYGFAYPGAPDDKVKSPFMENFLKGIEELEKSGGNEVSLMKALREYWFALHVVPASQRWTEELSSSGVSFPLRGNSSARDVTLRDISTAFMLKRLPYAGDPQFTAPPKNNLTKNEKRAEEWKEERGLTP